MAVFPKASHSENEKELIQLLAYCIDMLGGSLTLTWQEAAEVGRGNRAIEFTQDPERQSTSMIVTEAPVQDPFVSGSVTFTGADGTQVTAPLTGGSFAMTAPVPPGANQPLVSPTPQPQQVWARTYKVSREWVLRNGVPRVGDWYMGREVVSYDPSSYLITVNDDPRTAPARAPGSAVPVPSPPTGFTIKGLAGTTTHNDPQPVSKPRRPEYKNFAPNIQPASADEPRTDHP